MKHAMMTQMFPLPHPVTVKHGAVDCSVVTPLEHLVAHLELTSSLLENNSLVLTCIDLGDAS